MITIIVGTNRKESNSLKVALNYKEMLSAKGVESQIYNLMDLPVDFLLSDMYGTRSSNIEEVIKKYIDSVNCFVFILPEYHGGFPGVAKLFLDGVDSHYFQHKQAALIGVSSGRQGNSRGLDAFGNVLNYLQVEVLSKKVKLSGIESLLNEEGEFINEECLNTLNSQIDKMLTYFVKV